MGRRVDAAGQAGGDGEAGGAQVGGQPLGQAPAVGRGVAGADHGDRSAGSMRRAVAEQADHRRGVLDFRQTPPGSRSLPSTSSVGAEGLQGRHLVLGLRRPG